MKRVFILIGLLGMGIFVGLQPVKADTMMVTDLLGRRMTVPANPQRIVSLAPNITEIVFALGQEHRLVGVTRYSDFPPAAESLPRIGSYVHLDLERIVSLSPDLCLGIKDGNPLEAVRRLESLGIPVYAVDPRNLASVMETLLTIGNLLGAQERADQVVQNMRTRIEVVEHLLQTIDDRPGVFFQIGVSPIVSAGSHTFIHELIVQAGGRNLAEGRIPYPRFSREQVLGLSPDIIIITSMARAAAFQKVKAEWSRWSDLPAVKNQRIFVQDSNLFDRPTPRLVDALELLVKLIHPELFGE
jgi:iron complex transport system substrate-binding protein